MPGMLEGVRVLEVAAWGAMPIACALLADWGAEVIKVENPEGGDGWRGIVSIHGAQGGDCWWQLYNRGKKSIALDLRHAQGQEALHRLVATADIVTTNFRTAVLQKLRVDYPTLRVFNDRLIYGRLTGYGSLGPDRDLPGYDYSAFWARSGIMERVSEPGRPPRPIRPGLGDNTTSIAIAAGLSAALFHREQTGQGQEVHFSLYHTAVWAIAMDVQMALSWGEEIPQNDHRRAPNPLWNTYQTQDGRWLQLVMLQPDKYWSRFCEAIGKPEMEQDPRFDTMEAREGHSEQLVEVISETMAARPMKEWEERLRAHDLVHGRIQRVMETIQDPQAWANDFFAEVEGPTGPMTLVNSPVRFQQNPSAVQGIAPELGQNTEEVLLELGGYTWKELEQLKNAGAIPR